MQWYRTISVFVLLVYNNTFFKDVDECLESLDNCDNSSAICTNTIGGFNCSCTNGFTGDGINCSSMTVFLSINYIKSCLVMIHFDTITRC